MVIHANRKHDELVARDAQKTTLQAVPIPIEIDDDGEDNSTLAELDTSLIKRQKTYDFVCNEGRISQADVGFCITYMNIWGEGEGRKCGNNEHCVEGGLKVWGTLWNGAPGNYAANCKLASNALKRIWEMCGERGGKFLSRVGLNN